MKSVTNPFSLPGKKSGKRCEFFDEEIFWGELVTAL